MDTGTDHPDTPPTVPGDVPTLAERLAKNKANGPSARTRVGGKAQTRVRAPESEAPPGTNPPESDKPKVRRGELAILREGILEVYTAAQMMANLADPQTAMVIGLAKEQCAEAWVSLAEKDPRVRKMLLRLTQGGAWGGIVMAHLPIVLPLLARKGILPGGALFGGFGSDTDTPDANGAPVVDTSLWDGFVPAN